MYYIYCKLLFIPDILPLCWVPVTAWLRELQLPHFLGCLHAV